MVALKIKRLIDIIGAFMALLLLLPTIIIISSYLFAKFGRNILFKQQRAGFAGKPFVMYKFRTMNNKFNSKGKLLSDEQRLTCFGRILRNTSLDELPEFYNVLRGDMSLVGPRPLLIEYIKYYTDEENRRHDVKPGITGWAQINGRNAISWDKKFKLDVWYVDNWSIVLDLKILASTLNKVITRKDINAQGHATMPYFRGTKGD